MSEVSVLLKIASKKMSINTIGPIIYPGAIKLKSSIDGNYLSTEVLILARIVSASVVFGVECSGCLAKAVPRNRDSAKQFGAQ